MSDPTPETIDPDDGHDQDAEPSQNVPGQVGPTGGNEDAEDQDAQPSQNMPDVDESSDA